MNLEKINKEWITVDDMQQTLKIFPRWFVKFLMENSTVMWTTKRRYRYVDDNGDEVITRNKPCVHVTSKYDVVYGTNTERKVDDIKTEDPTPPEFPLSRIIREGSNTDCPYCHSTVNYRWFGLGRSLGCIQPKCKNYYGKLIKE